MINVGTLVTVDTNKAKMFSKPRLLKHTGVGIITEMPSVWKHNYQGGPALDLGSADPTCWTRVQFGNNSDYIPSDYLIIVEGK